MTHFINDHNNTVGLHVHECGQQVGAYSGVVQNLCSVYLFLGLAPRNIQTPITNIFFNLLAIYQISNLIIPLISIVLKKISLNTQYIYID